MATYAAINGQADGSESRFPQVNATLNSWKEIAVFFGRGVRTVQRWERELGLPVHRIRSTEHSPVFAFRNELRIWLESRRNAGLGKLPACPDGEAIKRSSSTWAETRSRSQQLTETMCKLLLQQAQYTEQIRQNLQATMRALNREQK